jgi:hypothetical protein
MTIAGSDSGGGAGIQADLKAFARAGVHGASAVTAITVQNTVGVTGVHAIPPETIKAQARAVIEDLGVDAIKLGMLGDVATITAVAEVLDELPPGRRSSSTRSWSPSRVRGSCRARPRSRSPTSSCRARRSPRRTCPRRAR